MKMTHEVVQHRDDDVLVVAFAGSIPPGSQGNKEAGIGYAYIETHLTTGHTALVVDLADLDYAWGDYVGDWLASAVRKRIPIRLVATGTTAKALMGLLGAPDLANILGEPMLQPTVDAALDSLP